MAHKNDDAEDLVLDYSVDRQGGELDLRYRVINRSGRRIYLLTPLADITDEGPTPAPSKAYTFLDEGGVLHVTKRLWLLPEGVSVYMPEVPYATRVLPGATFEDRLKLKLPIPVNYPYRFAGEVEPEEPPETITADAQGLAFSIGYLAEGDEPLPLEPLPGRSGEIFVVSYGVAAEEQVLLQGDALVLPVPVEDINA